MSSIYWSRPPNSADREIQRMIVHQPHNFRDLSKNSYKMNRGCRFQWDNHPRLGEVLGSLECCNHELHVLTGNVLEHIQSFHFTRVVKVDWLMFALLQFKVPNRLPMASIVHVTWKMLDEILYNSTLYSGLSSFCWQAAAPIVNIRHSPIS